MSKEKETKAEKVDVTMTPDERDAFVNFMAKQKEKDEKEASSKRQVSVHLNFTHHINGKKMGPGAVTVPEEWVGMLQRAENNWRDHELKLLSSTNRMFEVLQSGQSIERFPTKK
jgi:hypothetical protein